MEKRLKRVPGVDYLSGDLYSPRAMVKMDITDIHYPDNSFSVIYCSHVLEHVPEDRKAIAEFFRVLAPGGWALLQVPVMAKEKSWEDPGITDPAERKKHFGHPEHLRAYGPDFIDLLRNAGFAATAYRAREILNNEEQERMSVSGSRWIFFCSKPVS